MRLIDKDEAIKILCDGCTADCDVQYTSCITVQKIVDMPTVEAEPVRHGRTNADRIRAMTDEELSVFIGGIADNCSYNTCDNCPMYGACVDVPLSRDKWLKQEVQENAAD